MRSSLPNSRVLVETDTGVNPVFNILYEPIRFRRAIFAEKNRLVKFEVYYIYLSFVTAT